MSSSSPPQPQKKLEYPLTLKKCSVRIAKAPPTNSAYGNLKLWFKKKKTIHLNKKIIRALYFAVVCLLTCN